MEAILNRGVLGQMLDIADKLAYTARDLWACEPYIQYGAKHMHQEGLQELLGLWESKPDVCSLWDSILIEGNRVGFVDVERLETFLKIRTLMFRELYMHPHARLGEWLVARVLVKALYKQGELTRDQLLKMKDFELEKLLNEKYSGRYVFAKPLVEDLSDQGQCRSFATLEEALQFQASLLEQGNPFALIEDNSRPIKTGIHFNVATQRGLLPFEKMYPERAEKIRKMAEVEFAVHVYFLTDEPAISREALAKIAEL